MYKYNLKYPLLCSALKQLSEEEKAKIPGLTYGELYDAYVLVWQSLCCDFIEQAIINTKETIKKQLEKIGIKIESIEELKKSKKIEFENKAKEIEEKEREIEEKEEIIKEKQRVIKKAEQYIEETRREIEEANRKIKEARQKIGKVYQGICCKN